MDCRAILPPLRLRNKSAEELSCARYSPLLRAPPCRPSATIARLSPLIFTTCCCAAPAVSALSCALSCRLPATFTYAPRASPPDVTFCWLTPCRCARICCLYRTATIVPRAHRAPHGRFCTALVTRARARFVAPRAFCSLRAHACRLFLPPRAPTGYFRTRVDLRASCRTFAAE